MKQPMHFPLLKLDSGFGYSDTEGVLSAVPLLIEESRRAWRMEAWSAVEAIN